VEEDQESRFIFALNQTAELQDFKSSSMGFNRRKMEDQRRQLPEAQNALNTAGFSNLICAVQPLISAPMHARRLFRE
jgi:hypothetical protein